MDIRRHLKLGASAYITLSLVCILFFAAIIGFHDKYTWESGKTKFSVFYSSRGTALQREINIRVSEKGEYEFIEYAVTALDSDREAIRRHNGTLTDSEMEELFDYMINRADFFKLKENLSKDKNRVADASYDYLEVNLDGNVHRIGGYAASLDKTFMKACKKLHEITERFTANR